MLNQLGLLLRAILSNNIIKLSRQLSAAQQAAVIDANITYSL